MARRTKIAVATQPANAALTADDRAAFDLLEAAGTEVIAIPWSQEGIEWGAFEAVVIRSTWDYHRHLDAFRRWAREVEGSGAKLWNPAAVVIWNSEKSYLRELEAAGIPIVPTKWIDAGSSLDLAGVLEEAGWPEVVVKPTISASAYRTWTQKREEAEAHQSDFESLLAHSGAMIQPLLPEVLQEGEWSFLFFRRQSQLAFSHAVLKSPAEGDFRVQAELGGKTVQKTPNEELLRQVENLVAKAEKLAPGRLLYARIDGVVSLGEHAPAGTFLLMELELIEPFLFLEVEEGAATRFASAVAGVL